MRWVIGPHIPTNCYAPALPPTVMKYCIKIRAHKGWKDIRISRCDDTLTSPRNDICCDIKKKKKTCSWHLFNNDRPLNVIICVKQSCRCALVAVVYSLLTLLVIKMVFICTFCCRLIRPTSNVHSRNKGRSSQHGCTTPAVSAYVSVVISDGCAKDDGHTWVQRWIQFPLLSTLLCFGKKRNFNCSLIVWNCNLSTMTSRHFCHCDATKLITRRYTPGDCRSWLNMYLNYPPSWQNKTN